jgi:hypothetical protein
MGLRNWCCLLAVVALNGLLSAEARSQEFANAAYSNDLAALNDRLAALERQAQMSPADCGAASDCACENSCGDCGWFAGAGAYFLAPRWTTNPAFSSAIGGGGVAVTSQTDFDYGLSASPVAWLGYRGPSGLGVELRGWWFDDSETLNMTNAGGGLAVNSAAPLGLRNTSTTAGDVLSFGSSLDIDLVDLVGSYQADFGFGTLDFGAGVRYARVAQAYRHVEDPAANNLLDVIDSSHAFEGFGPTLALVGRAAITQRLRAIAALRYSLLFGDYDQQATSISDNVLVATRTHSTEDFLSIGELELGAEYVMPWRSAEFFLDGAFVAQIWQGAGNSANNDSIIVLVDPEVSNKDANLAMLGFRLGGGVRF